MGDMNFLWQKGALVDVIIKRWSMRIKLDKKDLSVAEDYPLPDIINLGNKRLLPKNVEGSFIVLENKSRNLLKDNGFEFPIGRNTFIPFKVLTPTLESLYKNKEDWITFKNSYFDGQYEKDKDFMLSK